jgi:hypothetical protein
MLSAVGTVVQPLTAQLLRQTRRQLVHLVAAVQAAELCQFNHSTTP